MKKIILLVIFIVTAGTTAFSQNTHTVIKQGLDSVVTSKGNKNVFFYDSKGKGIFNARYYWDDTTNDWIGDYKEEYTYNTNGDQTVYIRYHWDDAINGWRGVAKYESLYDNNSRRTIYFNHWGDDWAESENYKSEYTYNNAKPTMSIIYVRNDTNDDWRELEKIENTYDDNGNRTMQICYDWNIEWRRDEKYENTYDNSGNRTTHIRYRWEYYNNDWIEVEKSEHTYDNNGNQTMFVDYRWNTEMNDWIKSSKYEYEYDPSYSKTDLIMMPEHAYYITDMRTKSIYYKWSGTDWIEKEVSTYHWSAKEITVETNQQISK